MTKAIKFNLTIDKQPIRDLEEILENYNLDELLEYYKNGLLARWLEVRDLTAELTKLKAIQGKDEITIATELCKIFQADLSEDKIKAAVYPFEFRLKEIEELKQLKENKFNREEIIVAYHSEYEALKHNVIENKFDMSFLKHASNEICNKYLKLFEINCVDFFNTVKNEAPLAVYAVLMNENLRNFFMENHYITKCLKEFVKTIPLKLRETTSSSGGYGYGLELIDGRDFPQISMHYFSGSTTPHWKNFVEGTKKVMVLAIPTGSAVKSPDNFNEELTSDMINDKFLILNGLQYRSDDAQNELIYFEI